MIKRIKQHPVKFILVALSILFVLYICCNAIGIWEYAKIDETCEADVAIILGAGTNDGEVTPVFRERIHHGIWLYHNGYVKKLIFTGGYGKGNKQSDSATAKEYACSLGIPETDILIEEKSVITQENINYAKSLMEENNLKTALIVSDPLHMKRAMLMAKDAGIEAYTSPTKTSMYISLKNKMAFLGREVFFYTGINNTVALQEQYAAGWYNCGTDSR